MNSILILAYALPITLGAIFAAMIVQIDRRMAEVQRRHAATLASLSERGTSVERRAMAEWRQP